LPASGRLLCRASILGEIVLEIRPETTVFTNRSRISIGRGPDRALSSLESRHSCKGVKCDQAPFWPRPSVVSHVNRILFFDTKCREKRGQTRFSNCRNACQSPFFAFCGVLSNVSSLSKRSLSPARPMEFGGGMLSLTRDQYESAGEDGGMSATSQEVTTCNRARSVSRHVGVFVGSGAAFIRQTGRTGIKSVKSAARSLRAPQAKGCAEEAVQPEPSPVEPIPAQEQIDAAPAIVQQDAGTSVSPAAKAAHDVSSTPVEPVVQAQQAVAETMPLTEEGTTAPAAIGRSRKRTPGP